MTGSVRRRFFLLPLALVAGGLLLAFAGIYAYSEARLRAYPTPPAFDHPVSLDEGSIARGRHLALTRGCFGCHGRRLEGAHLEGWPGVTVAPNLPAYARQHDDRALSDAIRYGIGSDGRALWSMPSYNWRHLSDADTAALIAFLRSLPVVHKELPPARRGWKVRWQLARGAEPHMATLVSWVPALVMEDAGTKIARGEYLAMTTCNECHGLDLRGQTLFGASPDLAAILRAYTPEDFRTLMREGVAIGGRDNLPLMSDVARSRFAHFTDREIEELYAFFLAVAERPPARDVPWRPSS